MERPNRQIPSITALDRGAEQMTGRLASWGGRPSEVSMEGGVADGAGSQLRGTVSAAELEALTDFVRLVRSSPHNLVSRRARDELWSRHVPECVNLAKTLPTEVRRVLDVGSGGGFPGLVVAIMRPDLEVHLLDSIAKKTAFLASTSTELGLDVVVHHGRAELLAKASELRRTFDVVTARAVAPLTRLLPVTLPFLRKDGLLYAVKGGRWSEELTDAREVLVRMKATVVSTPDEADPGLSSEGEATEPPVPSVLVIRAG